MEDKLHSFLVNWTINFVKNRDILSKKIEHIENGRDGFDLYVKYKDKEQYFIIIADIAHIDAIIQRMNSNSHFSIVTLNSKDNFGILLKNWDKLIDYKFLSIIFINPFSKIDKKWIVFPHTHQKISDASSLKNGLKSMFEMVEPIEEGQLAEKIG